MLQEATTWMAIVRSKEDQAPKCLRLNKRLTPTVMYVVVTNTYGIDDETEKKTAYLFTPIFPMALLVRWMLH